MKGVITIKPTLYPFSPSQALLKQQEILSLRKNVSQIFFYMQTEYQFDMELMKKAIHEEMKRNDCLRMRLTHVWFKTMQYFLEDMKPVAIPVYDFTGKTKQDQEDFFTRKASKTLHVYRGQMYEIFLFKGYDGKHGVCIRVHHVCMDQFAVNLFFREIREIYVALRDGTEMAKPLDRFEDALKRDLSIVDNKERRKANVEFFTQYLKDVGPRMYAGADRGRKLAQTRIKRKQPDLLTVSIINLFNAKSGQYSGYIDGALANRMRAYGLQYKVSMSSLMLFCLKVYLAGTNHSKNVTVLAICNRRLTKADYNSGGCRAVNLTTALALDADMSFLDASRSMQKTQMNVLRHSDVVGLDITAIENDVFKVTQGDINWTTIYTYMPKVYFPGDDWNCTYSGCQPGTAVYPMYSMFYEEPNGDGIACHYQHRLADVSRDDIEKLQQMLPLIIQMGMDNPEIRLGEIYDAVTRS